MKSIAKKSLSLSILLFCLSSFTAYSNKLSYDSTSCLELVGKIINANEGIDGSCKIELICNNEVIDTLLLKEGKKKFKFVLSKNKYYAIRVSKKGYISRLLSVDTKLFNEIEGIYKFEFDMELIDERFASRLNSDALDFPVAIIYFDNEEDCFNYSREYTSALKRELYSGNKSHKNSDHTSLPTLTSL